MERWGTVVELTFDIVPEDEKERYPGDAPGDFSTRAFERVRPELNRMVKDHHDTRDLRDKIAHLCNEYDLPEDKIKAALEDGAIFLKEGIFAHFHRMKKPYKVEDS